MMQDKSNCISFVCLEKWEFQKRRVSMTVVISQTGDSTYITVRTHGCEIELPNAVLGSLPLVKRVSAVLDHIKNSTLCGGFRLPEGENLVTLGNDHLEGCFRDLTEDSAQENPLLLHFSSRCKIFFSVHHGLCSECKNLLKAHTLKKQREEKRPTIHPLCNKRYLTKEEMKFALQNEKNATLNGQQKERYWREKFVSEAVELEDEDHGDLSAILTTISKEKVPEEMLCLWEQQKKAINKKIKHGNRWHPKSVYLNNLINI